MLILTGYSDSNDECLVDADAPYTLAYAVIMLNTDQHNPNASKQNVPMTNEQVNIIAGLRFPKTKLDLPPLKLTLIF